MSKALKFPDRYFTDQFCFVCKQVRPVVGIEGVNVRVWRTFRFFYAPLLNLRFDCGHTCLTPIWNEKDEMLKYESHEEALAAAERIAQEILEFNKDNL